MTIWYSVALRNTSGITFTVTGQSDCNLEFTYPNGSDVAYSNGTYTVAAGNGMFYVTQRSTHSSQNDTISMFAQLN